MRISKWKVFILGFLGFFLVLGFIYRDLLSYALMQGKGQWSVIRGAKPVTWWLEPGNLSPEKVEKLALIEQIRTFAFEQLGINYSDNYTTMYDDEGGNALWVISACPPFSLDPLTWSFPIVGTFSYKGFFDKQKADLFFDELKEQGLDVSMRPVAGWSTLGWFKDPVMASMLKRSEGDLANLIIHELTHGTIFVKNDTELNENIASFVGDVGAELFLANKYGVDSEELLRYKAAREDYQTFSLYWLEQSKHLEAFYDSIRAIPVEQKKELKKERIATMVAGMNEVPFNRSDAYANYFNSLPNNTFFTNFRRYRSRQGIFNEELTRDFGGDLRAFISHYKMLYP
jgi:predicted aminopeptidase